jgi:hypothetical protein
LILNLRRLSNLIRIQALVSEICDTSFLFSHRAIVPIYFGHLFDNDKKEAYRLPVRGQLAGGDFNFFSAEKFFNNCILEYCKKNNPNTSYQNLWIKFILCYLVAVKATQN